MKTTLLVVLALCAFVVTAQNPVDKITQAVEAFREAFQNVPPFNQYVASVQFTTLEAEKTYHNDIELSHDETWTSWCLDVTVGVNLPEDIRKQLPATFMNFKVFYNPIGSSPYDPSSSSVASSDDVICTAISFMCPDGTPVGRMKDCSFVCGSQPIGGLSAHDVMLVRDSFEKDYPSVGFVSIDILAGKISVSQLTPKEKLTDQCLVVTIPTMASRTQMPDVYQGVRVFYQLNFVCAQQLCADGSVVDCDEVCPEETSANGSILVPIIAIIFIVTLSTCCCYLRGRKCRAAKCDTTSVPLAKREEAYPSEQYELLQNQEHDAAMMQHMIPMPIMPAMYPMPMSPQMAAHMGLPPMPPVPPSMMLPNGTFPVMVQAPNGMWYPAPMHPEDA